jgi:hypothetical protein
MKLFKSRQTSTLAMIIAMVFVAIVGLKVLIAPAPYYLNKANEVNQTVQYVCPGSPLTYTSDIIVNKVPMTLWRIESIFSQTEHRTVYSDRAGEIEIFNWDEKVTAKEFEGAKSTPKMVILPTVDRQGKPFKTGVYRYIISLNSVNSNPVTLTIPFEFRASCFK